MYVLLSLFFLMPSAHAFEFPFIGQFQEKPVMTPKPLDGVLIEAVETYMNPKSNETLFGVGLYPLNPYFLGFGVHVAYSRYYDRKWAWEVINGSYVFGVERDLTAELADRYQVNPERIEKTQFTAASNLQYVHSYGKFILGDKYINYFRSSLLGGLGFVSTNVEGRLALSFGVRFEVQTSDKYSWKLDVRDLLTVTGEMENVIYVGLGTGISY